MRQQYTRNCPECDGVIIYPREDLRDYYDGRACPACNKAAKKAVLYKDVKRLCRGNPWAWRYRKRPETRKQAIRRYKKYINVIMERIDADRKRQHKEK